MQLYHLTLRQSGQVEKIAYGSFSGAKRHELAVISGSRVRLYAVASVGDSKTRRLVPKCSVDCFARMQSIQAVRVPGAKTDRILLSSDAGRLVLLKAVISDATGALTLVSEQCETYGKSGMRRDVPAKHMAVDPKGRAVMIAAIEAKKLVYVLGRTAESENITLSSPIEAHRPDHVVIDVVACDAGYGNPLFAVLEQQNYASNAATSMAPISQPHLKSRALGSASLPPKVLTLYELDLGINHVRRRKSILVNPSSHKLIPLPGAPEGPGGVLVCSFGRVSYYTLTAFDEDGADGSDSQSATLVCQIPLRNESDTADIQAEVLISAYALHRQRGMFFLLMANEFGDLLKLDFTLSTATAPAQVLARDDPPASVTATQMSLYYYDSLPGPTLDFVITKNGCLFNASEAGDHGLYLIQSLEEADNVEDGICTSAHGCLGDFDTIIPPTLRRKVFFDARRALRNLLVLDRLESLAPLLRPCAPNSDAPDLSVVQPSGEPETESDQISKDACIVAGAGSRRLVRLHRSLAVTELAVSELPARALNAFSLQLEPDGEDRFVLVSFANATLPLQVGESIQEATAVPFVKTERTLAACTLYDGKMIQVHRLGFCVIQAHAPAARSAPAAETDVKQNGNDTDSVLADANEAIVPATASVAESVSFTVAQDHLLAPKNRATDKYPEEPSVLQAAVSASQLILVTNKKQLMYFILDPSSGQMRLASRMDLVSSESVSDEKSDNAVSSICLPGTAHVLAGSQDLSASVPLALSLACNTSAPSDTYAGLCAVALGRSLRVLKLTPSAGDVRSNSSARLITPTALQMLPADVSDVTFIPLQGGDFAMLAATRAGSVVYSTVDHVSGTISGRFARLLGTDAVHFFDVRLVRAQLAESVFSAVRSQNQPHMYRPPLVVAVCGSSGTSWLVRNITSFGTSAGGLLFSPLRGVHMERGCSFASSHISPGGLVGVHKGKLLIAVIDEIEGVLLSLEESTSEHAAFHATFASAQHTVRRVLSLGQKSGHESSQRAGTRNAQSHLGASLQYVVLEADPVHRGSGGVTTKAGALASRVCFRRTRKTCRRFRPHSCLAQT
ncbi:Splicing factor 3B subunit 3 [Porphyridium purpureum]|uniref:Splicing factor 3B subunit 3 n=1 Tax=Porphyridium purpureum TaxID=35688 RepID=A0A5J4YWL7_PORPP|nr:Splicing factor 3B subunit 3 [Porphyridium purpureum]|eukprot:POR9783..scf227_4